MSIFASVNYLEECSIKEREESLCKKQGMSRSPIPVCSPGRSPYSSRSRDLDPTVLWYWIFNAMRSHFHLHESCQSYRGLHSEQWSLKKGKELMQMQRNAQRCARPFALVVSTLSFLNEALALRLVICPMRLFRNCVSSLLLRGNRLLFEIGLKTPLALQACIMNSVTWRIVYLTHRFYFRPIFERSFAALQWRSATPRGTVTSGVLQLLCLRL